MFVTACISAEPKTSSESFVEKVAGTGTVHLTGWAKLAGELEIYADRESLGRALRFQTASAGFSAINMRGTFPLTMENGSS